MGSQYIPAEQTRRLILALRQLEIFGQGSRAVFDIVDAIADQAFAAGVVHAEATANWRRLNSADEQVS